MGPVTVTRGIHTAMGWQGVGGDVTRRNARTNTGLAGGTVTWATCMGATDVDRVKIVAYACSRMQSERSFACVFIRREDASEDHARMKTTQTRWFTGGTYQDRALFQMLGRACGLCLLRVVLSRPSHRPRGYGNL